MRADATVQPIGGTIRPAPEGRSSRELIMRILHVLMAAVSIMLVDRPMAAAENPAATQQTPASANPLSDALAHGNFRVAMNLIQDGADVNASDAWHHSTPLYLACANLSADNGVTAFETVRSLVEH